MYNGNQEPKLVSGATVFYPVFLTKFLFSESLTKKIFRQINYLVISLVKTLLSRKFCQKCMKLNRSNFHAVGVEITDGHLLSHFWQKSCENNIFSK